MALDLKLPKLRTTRRPPGCCALRPHCPLGLTQRGGGRMGARAAGPWPRIHGRSGLLAAPAAQAGPVLTVTKAAQCAVSPGAQGALGTAPGRPRRRPRHAPGGASSAASATRTPLSLLCGKAAAGAGVAAGASCPCDRAEPGIRGHVGKTLVPAALPARNAPPAPQPPPAWPRNGDSPAPCSHPLLLHPPQPTTGLAAALQPPCLLRLLLLPAPAILQSLPSSFRETELGGTSWGVPRVPPQACLFSGLLLWLENFFGTKPLQLSSSLQNDSPLGPHAQHRAWSTGQVQKQERSQGNPFCVGSCGGYCSWGSSVTLE